jgi:hypothetical protein
LAPLREIVRLSVAAVRQQGEPFFPSEVWEKACITMLQNLRATANFMTTQNISDSEIFRIFSCGFAALGF